MKTNIHKIKPFFIAALLLSASPGAALAQLLDSSVQGKMAEQGRKFRETSGFSSGMTLSDVVETGIKGFLALLGVIFIILIIYAGFTWMNARGDEARVQKAQDTIQRAIIGLLITVAAYSITYFVFNAIDIGGSSSGLHGTM